VWHFYAREQKDYVKQVPLPAGWDRVFKDCRLQTLSASDGPLKITLDKLVPETVRMACFTQVPGFIYAASGERTQLLLSDNLGAALTGTLDERGRTVTLKVSATQPVQVLAYWDAAWGDPAAQTKAGETLPCRQETVGGRAFALIDAKAGESEMVISAKAK
jgi:hypothetical protein